MIYADTIGHVANVVKGYATAIGIAYAMWYFWMLHRRNAEWRAADNRARAQNIWSSFLERKLGLEGQPDPVFIAYLLSVADEILMLDPDGGWRGTLRDELAGHKAALSDAAFRKGTRCSPELGGLIDDLLSAA